MPIPLWLDFDARGEWGRAAFEKRLDDASASLRDLLGSVEDAPATQPVPRARIDAALAAFPDLKSWGGTAASPPGERGPEGVVAARL